MGRTRGKSPVPGDEVPNDGTDKRRDDKANGKRKGPLIKGRDIDDIFSNGLSHGSTKEEGTNKFAHCRHQKGFPWRESSCGNDRRYNIGCIMEAIGIVKKKGQDDDDGSKP
jgi:hypothetical protein